MKLSHSLILSTLTACGLATDTIGGLPCGQKIAACSEDTVCVPISNLCTDLDICRGKCEFVNEYEACDGRFGCDRGCPDDTECSDDPRDSRIGCNPLCVVPKICIPHDQPVCNGFAGFRCPDGLYCYDIPGDGCDADNGGADCLGICL